VSGASDRRTARASYSEAAAFGALSFAAMGVLSVGSGIVIARIYGVEVVGEYALVIAPMNAVWYLSSARERPAFVRELATLDFRAPRVTGLFAAMLTFSFALTVVVAAIGLAIAHAVFAGPIEHPELFAPAAVTMLGYVLVTNVGWNLDAVFSGFRAGRELFWIRIHQTLAFLVIGIVGGLVVDSVWGLVIATAGSSLTSLVHRLVAVRRFMRARVSREELRAGFRSLPRLIAFGLKIVPGSIANGVSNEAGTWVLGAMGSLAAVGAYNRAWMLGRRFVELNWRITEMLFPTLVERRATGDREGFDRALVDTIRYCTAGMLLPAAAAGGAATSVMALFGPGFGQAADALSVILLMPALITAAQVLRNALFAVDRPWLSSAIALVRMAITLATTVALTSWLGITGAALGLLAGALADVACMAVVIRGHLASRLTVLWPARQMGAALIAYAAGFAAARGVETALPGLAGLGPALVAGCAAYAAVFAAAGGVTSRDRRRLGRAVALLRSRRRGPAAAHPSSVS
jgi:O-antigen/teichoic acid export membrane protein